MRYQKIEQCRLKLSLSDQLRSASVRQGKGMDSIERYWPLIQQHPWAFLWVLAAGTTLGWYAHGILRPVAKTDPNKAPTKDSAWTQLRSSARKLLFFPNRVQIDCIKGLRLVDRKALTVTELATLLAHHEMDTSAYPSSDVEQALQALHRVEWVKMSWNQDLVPLYTLHGGGLDYARRRGYSVLPISGD